MVLFCRYNDLKTISNVKHTYNIFLIYLTIIKILNEIFLQQNLGKPAPNYRIQSLRFK